MSVPPVSPYFTSCWSCWLSSPRRLRTHHRPAARAWPAGPGHHRPLPAPSRRPQLRRHDPAADRKRSRLPGRRQGPEAAGRGRQHWSRPDSRWRRSTRPISSCRPSRPRPNFARRPGWSRRRAPPKAAPTNCGRRAGRPRRNSTRPRRPPTKRARGSTARERSVELTKNSLSYATLVADAPGSSPQP